LIDAENTISDSWENAKYLETEYPDTPSLKLDHGEVLFIKFWVETVLHPELLQLLVMDIYNNLAKKDQKYFRESREKRFGKALEEIVINRNERLPRFQKLLNPLRTTLKKQDFVAGETPGFSDYIVYEGWKLKGWPVKTIIRGQTVSEDFQVTGKCGYGKLVSRKTNSA